MIGKLLGERYEIIEQIGGGGMALVYKAKCNLLNRFVAVKILRDEYAEDDEFVQKFRMESQAAASLSHPNIVNIYDVGIDEIGGKKIHYIVMEYIKGKTLKDLIKERGNISIDESINWAMQIAKALQAAHRNNIIHRDIKPQNIMIDESNRVKVMDFGIARAATSSTMATSSEVLGSVHYFSPEQAKGRYTDAKSDIYSLGIVFYEMVTGKIPYSGKSPVTIALKHMQEDIIPPSEVNPKVPKDVEKVILKCVEKKQADRYLNMDELISDLLKLVKRHNVDMDASHSPMMAEALKTDMNMTRKLPRMEGEKVPRKKPIKTNANKNREKKDNIKVILLGVLMAFIVTSSAFFGINKWKNFRAGNEIVMEDLVGMEEQEARRLVEEQGLKFEVLKRIKDDTVEKGIILSQETAQGVRLKKGFPVQVVVSDGQGDVKVPNLVNKNVFEAERMLRRVGLAMGKTRFEPSSTIEAEKIIRQNISENTSVESGTKIDVVVSQGSDVKEEIAVPRLLNLTIEEARNALQNEGLKLGSADVEDSPTPKGRVTWQSHSSGSNVEKGTVVNVKISSGSENIIKPEEKPEEKPVEKEEAEKDFPPITVNVTSDGTEVKIIRIQDGSSEVIHNQRYDAGYQTIPVRGKNNARFEIYIDGVSVGSQ